MIDKEKQTEYMSSYLKGNVITSFSMNKESDAALIEWLAGKKNRGEAIRQALRHEIIAEIKKKRRQAK